VRVYCIVVFSVFVVNKDEYNYITLVFSGQLGWHTELPPH